MQKCNFPLQIKKINICYVIFFFFFGSGKLHFCITVPFRKNKYKQLNGLTCLIVNVILPAYLFGYLQMQVEYATQ